jgi:hypothetical protein
VGTTNGYAMQTPDGAWRVEVVKRGRSQWYRVARCMWLRGEADPDWATFLDTNPRTSS